MDGQQNIKQDCTILHDVNFIHVRVYIPCIYPLNDELNPMCHLQALLGAHHILHVFRIMVKFRLFSKSQKSVRQYK